jgi:hypothetical protein
MGAKFLTKKKPFFFEFFLINFLNKQSTTQVHQIHGPHFFPHSAIGPKNLK